MPVYRSHLAVIGLGIVLAALAGCGAGAVSTGTPMGFVAILGVLALIGIIIATVLTLMFLPALYVAWYRIKEPMEEDLKSQAD